MFKQCSKCKFFQYFSRTCQQKHWNEHKSVCQELSYLNKQNKNNQFHKEHMHVTYHLESESVAHLVGKKCTVK